MDLGEENEFQNPREDSTSVALHLAYLVCVFDEFVADFRCKLLDIFVALQFEVVKCEHLNVPTTAKRKPQ